MKYLAPLLGSLVLGLSVVGPVQANEYPTKAIKVVVPFPPGGGTDLAGRQMADRLAQVLPADVIVENKPGAGGNIAAHYAARATPDGYTLLVGTVGTQLVNAVAFPTEGFNPSTDFVALGWWSSVPNVVVVGADSPYNSIQELIEAGKSKPDGLTYGSGGTGSTTHLSVELLQEMTGMTLTHAPYKGSAPAVVDLIGGRLDFMIDNLTSANSQIQGGKLKILAVTTKSRLPAFPDTPAVAEVPGLESYEAVGWTGLFAPKGVDPAIVKKLSDAMSSTQDLEALKARVAASGSMYVGGDSPQFTTFLVGERDKWLPIAEKAFAR